VLRVRHLLHGLQPRGCDHLELSRGWPRRGVQADMSTDITVAVCLKWVDRRVDADALLRAVVPDERFAGVSAADQAALEWAVRYRDDVGAPVRVLAVTVGPTAADTVLRDALAAGADRAI